MKSTGKVPTVVKANSMRQKAKSQKKTKVNTLTVDPKSKDWNSLSQRQSEAVISLFDDQQQVNQLRVDKIIHFGINEITRLIRHKAEIKCLIVVQDYGLSHYLSLQAKEQGILTLELGVN